MLVTPITHQQSTQLHEMDELERLIPVILEVDDDLLPGLVDDIAQGIHSHATVAMRYGLGSEAELLTYLKQHPVVLNQIRRHKAAHLSDGAVVDRVRLKAGLAVEDLIPELTHIVRDGNTPTGQRIDGFHKLMRAAGTDGNVAAVKDSGGGEGTSFTLNFIWSDGTRESITGTRDSGGPKTIDQLPDDDA